MMTRLIWLKKQATEAYHSGNVDKFIRLRRKFGRAKLRWIKKQREVGQHGKVV